MPPHHSGLKISPVTTLRATRSLCSLRQALRLTPPAKFSPFGHRPPFKGAGSCTNAFLVSCIFQMHIPHEHVLSHDGADPHPLKFFAVIPSPAYLFLRTYAVRRTKSAYGHCFPCGREYGSSPRLSPAPKPGSSSGAASLFVPPFCSGALSRSAAFEPGH